MNTIILALHENAEHLTKKIIIIKTYVLDNTYENSPRGDKA